MKLKKMVVCITKKDIRNFLKLQDKINTRRCGGRC